MDPALLARMSVNPRFAALLPVDQQALLQHAERKQLRPGEMLFRQGDALGGFYGLLSGGLKISSLREDGREAIFVLMARGDAAMADDAQPTVPVSQEAQWRYATGASKSPVPSG